VWIRWTPPVYQKKFYQTDHVWTCKLQRAITYSDKLELATDWGGKIMCLFWCMSCSCYNTYTGQVIYSEELKNYHGYCFFHRCIWFWFCKSAFSTTVTCISFSSIISAADRESVNNYKCSLQFCAYDCHLGCDNVQFGRQVQNFRVTCCFHVNNRRVFCLACGDNSFF